MIFIPISFNYISCDVWLFVIQCFKFQIWWQWQWEKKSYVHRKYKEADYIMFHIFAYKDPIGIKPAAVSDRPDCLHV